VNTILVQVWFLGLIMGAAIFGAAWCLRQLMEIFERREIKRRDSSGADPETSL
jgi:uncharacterized membrane protein YciS (DUF1049 family)